ncbi:MAG: hypothetical protein AB1405_00190 [Bdellovibrionota bacterium]
MNPTRVALLIISVALTAIVDPFREVVGNQYNSFSECVVKNLAIYAFMFVGPLLVLTFHSLRLNEFPWTKSFWAENPFHLRNPFQLFHFVSWTMLLSGVLLIIRQLLVSSQLDYGALAILFMGSFFRGGIFLSELIFSNKFTKEKEA